jgi:hypothetical protein
MEENGHGIIWGNSQKNCHDSWFLGQDFNSGIRKYVEMLPVMFDDAH